MLFLAAGIPSRTSSTLTKLRGTPPPASSNCMSPSRATTAKKTYVQDLLREQADRVWSLIEQGAILYVCGDGSHMEPDVKRALMAIHGENRAPATRRAGLDGDARRRGSLRARRMGGI